jgi:hypothetical protein
MGIKISYAISVCNEFVEIQRLITYLLEHKRDDDNIVVLFDSINGSESVEEFLRANSLNGEFSWHPYPFDGHFARMKNKLTALCSGDYIINIDADEMVDEYFIRLIPQVLEQNKVEVILMPRINTVEGLTPEHVLKWGWNVNDKNHINFPDFQWRIYKNSPEIYWENKVHERLTGYKTISHLPQTEEWCLIHHKTIEKQEKQNNYYATL